MAVKTVVLIFSFVFLDPDQYNLRKEFKRSFFGKAF